jgi:hypothetical protein
MRSTNNSKRRNHEVPKGLLKNWIDRTQNKTGHHYFDIDKQAQKFEEGNKAKFAITDYLYVPFDAKGERDDTLENWFSIDENGLAIFSSAFQNGDINSIKNNQLYINQAIRSCIALGYRSAFHFYKTSETISRNDQIAANAMHHEMVQNAWRVYELKFKQFRNWDFMVLYNLPIDLLINERPFHDWTLKGDGFECVSMPIAPSALLIGTAPPDKSRESLTFSCRASADKRDFCERHNHFVIETARQWVVSKTPEQMQMICGELTRSKVEERKKKDRTIFFALDKLKSAEGT